jgi:UDP-N-acetylmuramoyl-tripeptide--D-alanyl-D-alanine ligase
MRRPLWTIAEMAVQMSARLVGDPPQAIVGLSIDSRTIAPGEAFFAIRGDRFDGHDFVVDANQRSAAVAVVSAAWFAQARPSEGAFLVVDDVLAELRNLAIAARARTDARIIAITGSVGKTGTKDALRLALAPSGAVHASTASFNNHWGVPLSLARMPADTDFGIFEIGMNHPGEITPLVAMVTPHIAVITTIAPVHLEYFSSIEEIARAKAEIFSGLEADGLAILNGDNEQCDFLRKLARAAGVTRIQTFGQADGSDARLQKSALLADCSCVRATVCGRSVAYKVGVPGRHVVHNTLGVLLAVVAAGADLAKAMMALAQLRPAKGRGARDVLTLRDGNADLIDESYNANPASMRAAIAVLGQSPTTGAGRRIAVLGDMLELGGEGAQMHADLAEPMDDAGVDVAYLCGPLMKNLWHALPARRRAAYGQAPTDLQARLMREIIPGDVVMIKGSLGSRMGPIVEALKTRYPTENKV